MRVKNVATKLSIKPKVIQRQNFVSKFKLNILSIAEAKTIKQEVIINSSERKTLKKTIHH